ncbi:MAG: cupredoxin domain-containing protein [Gammaproteobacteria bacterium]|nr:MAG: cupredoxin domain-containing protein [Gammaproteobacteria bacterium]
MKLNAAILLFILGILARSAVAGGDANIVTIRDYSFNPQEITIKRGETVRWENHEKRQYHSVWFEASGEEQPDYFFPDESYERTFMETGSFPYRCGPHEKMTGVVHVTE